MEQNTKTSNDFFNILVKILLGEYLRSHAKKKLFNLRSGTSSLSEREITSRFLDDIRHIETYLEETDDPKIAVILDEMRDVAFFSEAA